MSIDVKTAAVMRVLAVASAFADFTEQGGENRGQVVERMLKGTGLGPGYPWCAAFVAHCGYYGLYDLGIQKSVWPVKRTASCWELGEFARVKRVLKDDPQPGDVFLVYYESKKRFAHTGFVVTQNADGSWVTIEGNTSGGGSREGWGVFRRTRRFKERDRFVRWVDLLDV